MTITMPVTKENRFLCDVDEFFESKVRENDEKLQWHPLVNRHEIRGDPYKPVWWSKIKVVLAGEGLTEIKIIDHDMKIHTGAGWEFLQPHLAAFKNFQNARVKVAVCLSNLWCMNNKAGLTLTATHLVLTFPKPRKNKKDDVPSDFGDVFSNDAQMLSELAEE